MVTDLADAPEQSPRPQGPVRGTLAFLRNTWRGLTSMRTALVLLFLLALAAMPGALLPQRSLNPPKTADYIAAHGWWGKTLDRLQFFDVYASVWFSAIYLLLFISLVGCLLPRTWEHLRSARAEPVLTPRNLARLPHHAESEVDQEPADVLAGPVPGCAAGGSSNARRPTARTASAPNAASCARSATWSSTSPCSASSCRWRWARCSATRARSSCSPTGRSSATPAS